MDDGSPAPPTAPPPAAPSNGHAAPGNGSRSGGGAASPRGFDRVPPHSLEAEVSVLGAALLSRAAAAEVCELLAPDDFYRSAHRTVFEGILELTSRGEPVDEVTMLEYLTRAGRLDEVGGATAILELTNAVPTAANAVHYARIVRDKALLRRLIEAGTDVVRLGYEADTDATTIVDRAEARIYEVAEGGTVSEYSQLKDLLNESFERIELLAQNRSEVTGLSTGFDDLDRLTAGLQPQNLIILAARPAMGKSSLAMNIAHYVTVKTQRSAAVFSLEMSKLEIVQRLLSAEAGIPSNRLRTGQLDDADWRKLGDALGSLSNAPLFIDDTPSITMMEIRSKCRRIKQRHGLELVIVDYLQLMESHRRSDARHLEVAEFSRGLKMLAKELDVPVVALSQLSRQPESRTDKRPQLSDLRESGCLTREMRLFRADSGAPITFGELLDGDDEVQVWARDDRGKLVAGRVTNVFPSGVKSTFRVRLSSGMQVEASGNHPFLTLDGWVALEDLPAGTRVATARRLPEPEHPEPMDPDELVLLAHLIGEGTVVARQPVHYTSADEANLEAVEKAVFARFGITARRAADGRSAVTTQLYLPAPYHLTHGRRNPVAAWLDGLGLWNRRSYEKSIPAPIFALPTDQVRFFLHHLWATDGSIGVRGPGRSGPRVRIYYSTSSDQLALDLQLLLLRLGIRARISTVTSKGRPNHHVRIMGAAQQRRFLTEVGCHGARGGQVAPALAALDGVGSNPNGDVLPLEIWDRIRERRSEIGMTERAFQAALGASDCGVTLYRSAPSRARLARIAAILDDDHLRDLADDDLSWDEVVSVEPLGQQEVFDATVAGHHNFVCEGVVLHNSLEQDADIVGFIYRDEVYDEDSPDRGIAELIISKHRNGQIGTIKLAFLGHLTKFANLARGSSGGGGGGVGL